MPVKIKTLILLLAALAVTTGLAAENRGLILLQSLAVPGLGQIRNDRGYGYAMLGSEVAIIGSMLYLNAEQNLKAQEYFEYAIKHAHIQNQDYPDQYFRDLSRYNSSGFEAGGYNAQIRQEAMQIYPNDPVQQQIYIDANIYPDNYAWNWDSLANRRDYSKIRIQTQDLRDYGKLAIGVMIVNHLISGVDALRFTAQNRKGNVYLDIKDRHPMVMFNLEL